MMKLVNFEVTITVKREGEGYGPQSVKVSILIPADTTNSTEILSTVEGSIVRDVKELVQQKTNPPKA
jgi:hypothetical protein